MKRSKYDRQSHKRCSIGLLTLCMALCLCGCGVEMPGFESQEGVPAASGIRELALEEIESQAEQYASGREEKIYPEANAFEGEVISTDGSCDYAYRQLSAYEQTWYRDIVQAIRTMTDKVKLSEAGMEGGLDEKNVDRIFQCVLSDHPEFFYVEGYTYTKYSQAEKTVAIVFSGTYSLDRETVLERRIEIEEAADRILAAAPVGTDDYEKTKYIYETLIGNTDYDLGAEDNQNLYSVFVNHSSVCQGYAKAAQYLLNRMGIECFLVPGVVLGTGESHAWNLVKPDGEYYYMDTTWGDIAYQGESGAAGQDIPQISYDYLNITTEQLQRTHRAEAVVELPDCTAQKDNYYVREGALFAEYDKNQLEALIDRLMREGRGDIAIRCATKPCYESMYEALVERQEIFDCIPENEVRKFAYISNEPQLTMTFFMMTSNR